MSFEEKWQGLQSEADKLGQLHLSELLANPNRFTEMSFRHDSMLIDFSRQRMQKDTLNHLVDAAQSAGLPEKIEALLSGEKINVTENRAALHTALRTPLDKSVMVDDINVVKGVHQTLLHMEKIVKQVHAGQWRGFSGEAIDTVVNIGVGGSDLGPQMACLALEDFKPACAKGIDLHFASSMDGSQLWAMLNRLNPATTLFVVSSKSFTTIDTLANATTAKQWLIDASGLDESVVLAHHFIAVTAKPEKAAEWGIPQDNQLLFWDWTGGRYSMWSAIGLPIALTTGMEGFHALLAGAHSMDEHFRTAPLNENLPVLLGMVGVWNINLLDIHAHAILPYDGRLAHLPAYLEQLEMESNGKSVKIDGSECELRTCPVLWGEIGPNAQHAFYQLLHQGTEQVMCDFVVPAKRYTHEGKPFQDQHQLALANCLAQARVLALGDKALSESEAANAAPWKHYSGNQPSSVILLDELTPYTLGMLIALYEHKVFVQSVIWGINPFDQWGVELGKKMATEMLGALEGTTPSSEFDCATQGLLDSIQSLRQQTV